MSGSKVSNKRFRDTQRVVHLTGGLMLGVYVYIPLLGDPAPQFVAALVQFEVFPALVATGVLMWQLPRLRRMWKGKREE
jgi:hypothetical protein